MWLQERNVRPVSSAYRWAGAIASGPNAVTTPGIFAVFPNFCPLPSLAIRFTNSNCPVTLSNAKTVAGCLPPGSSSQHQATAGRRKASGSERLLSHSAKTLKRFLDVRHPVPFYRLPEWLYDLLANPLTDWCGQDHAAIFLLELLDNCREETAGRQPGTI